MDVGRILISKSHKAIIASCATHLVYGEASASYVGSEGELHELLGCVGGHLWYVNRCLVQPAKRRGNGVGSQLLTALKDAVSKHRLSGPLVVTPGGYDADPAKQENFYKKAGFTVVPTEEGSLCMVWKLP